MNRRLLIACNRGFYQRHASAYRARTAPVELAPVYDGFLALLPRTPRILDVGAGVGDDAVAFAARGARVMAIDAEPAMVKRCRARGVDARVQLVEDFQATACYEGIWARASLLHVAPSVVSRAVRRLAKALRPGGWMFISVLKGSGAGIAPDGRFAVFYSLRSFRGVLRSAREIRRVCAWQLPPNRRGQVWLCFLAQRSDVGVRVKRKRGSPGPSGENPRQRARGRNS